MLRSFYFYLLAICTLSIPLSAEADYRTINIDGVFDDWVGVAAVDSDSADNPTGVDIADTYIANDGDYLYIRNTYHSVTTASTFVALDVDGDTSTGYDIFSLGLIGSEAGWQNDFPFTQAAGVYNSGVGMNGDFFGTGAALLATGTSDRELAISLDAMFNTPLDVAVFPDSTISLLIWTDVGAGDVGAPIAYTLATVPEPSGGFLLVLSTMLSFFGLRSSGRGR